MTVSIVFYIVFGKLLRNLNDELKFLFALTAIARISVSIYNSFFGVSLGGEEDAILFIQNASSSANFFDVGTNFYLNFLGNIFDLYERSSLIAHYLSCLFSLGFMLICLSFINNYYTKSVLNRLIIVYLLFLPSSILFMSISLRESYQAFFTVLMLMGSIRFINNQNFMNLCILVLSALCLGFFHKGLVIISAAYLFTILLFFSGTKVRVNSVIFLVFFGILLAPSLFQILGSGRGFEVALALVEGNVEAYTLNYRGSIGRLQTPATYIIPESNNFVIYSIFALFYYLFYPSLIEVNSFFSLYASIEGMLRLVLFALIIFYLIEKKHSQQTVFFVMIFLSWYMISSFAWGLGTSNYGQGLRHHITHNFMLVFSLVVLANVRTNNNLR